MSEHAGTSASIHEITALPNFKLTDLAGHPLTRDQLSGRVVLLTRMAWVIDDGVITKVFSPVFPPDKNAEEVVAWLQSPR